MTRIDSRPWAGVALFAAVLAYVGCSTTNTTDSSSSSPSASPTSSQRGASVAPALKGDPSGGGAESKSRKPLANLRNPTAVLIVSGEQDGYLEPCGCSEEQYGGVIRRFDFIELLHNQNKWPTAQIDLGSLTKDPAIARGGFEQAKIKFDYAAKALKLLKYDALALSAEDLKVGVGEALGLFLNDLGETTKVVVANVQPAAGYETIFRTSLVVTVGPVKLGITAVIEPAALEKLADPDKEALFPKIQRPDEVLSGVLAELEPKSDFQVLMVQGPPALAKRLAGAYPGFDIVISTAEFDDPPIHEPDLLNGNKTMLVNVGRKGKYVGVFGFYPDEPQRLRYQLVTLDKRYNGPSTPMKKLIQEEYRETLKAAGVVENFVRHNYVNGAPGATFVGAENCQSCHPKTYEKWASTGHAQGFDSLVDDPKPNTVFDAECITCHTTGFEYNTGWRSEAETPYLAGNQCENCHGPGSKHVAEPENAEYRKLIAVTAQQADKNHLCLRCHDGDNSPKFDFVPYHRRISHKGMDTYTDPKVHRGITPRLAGTKSSTAER